MERIMVIGCPGAGKSTFARELRDRTGLPLLYLDQIWHKADRTNVTQTEFDAALDQVLMSDRWIIDGNYMRTMERRLDRCDTVFFLDYPVELCLESAAARVGTVREEMPWVESEFDLDFRQWILDFPKDQLPKIYEMLDRACQDPERSVIVFRTRDEADRWLQTFGSERE